MFLCILVLGELWSECWGFSEEVAATAELPALAKLQILVYFFCWVVGVAATAVCGVMTFVVSCMNLNEVARVLTAPQINGNWKIYCHDEGFELCDEHTRIYAIFQATVFYIFPMGWVFFLALHHVCRFVKLCCPEADRFVEDHCCAFISGNNNEACDDDANAVAIDTNTVAIDYSILEDLRSVEAAAYAKTSPAMSSIRNSQQTSFYLLQVPR
jgi:hypothetical protein